MNNALFKSLRNALEQVKNFPPFWPIFIVTLCISVSLCFASFDDFKAFNDNLPTSPASKSADSIENFFDESTENADFIDPEETIHYEDYFRPEVPLKTKLMRELVDCVHARTILNNAYGAFEEWVRFGESWEEVGQEIKDSILNMKTHLIRNKEMRNNTKRYLKKLAEQVDTTSTEELRAEHFYIALDAYNELDSLLENKYATPYFNRITDDQFTASYEYTNFVDDYDQIIKAFGSDNKEAYDALSDRYKQSKNMNERCLLALAMVHTYRENDDNGSILGMKELEECIACGEYSSFLFETWNAWRTILQFENGLSKDSFLMNNVGNHMRFACLNTILKHIAVHPDDNFAIIEFHILNYWPNIRRYGPYRYGNQNVLEYYRLFPERFDHDDDDNDGEDSQSN